MDHGTGALPPQKYLDVVAEFSRGWVGKRGVFKCVLGAGKRGMAILVSGSDPSIERDLPKSCHSLEVIFVGQMDYDSYKPFITSDTHYFHKNIIEYCGRPYRNSWEMTEDLVERWNRKIPPGSLVIHLGDVMFPKGMWASLREGKEKGEAERDFISRLNGTIIHIQGNHDKRSLDCLYEESHKHLTIQVGGRKCFFTHYPMRTVDPLDKRKPDPEVEKSYDGNSFVVCGHVHEKWWANGKNLNVGVDVRADLSPLSWDELSADLDCLAASGARGVVPRRFDPATRTRCLVEIMDRFGHDRHPAMDEMMGLVSAPKPEPDAIICLADMADGGSESAKVALSLAGEAGEGVLRRLDKKKELREQGLSWSEINRRIGE